MNETYANTEHIVRKISYQDENELFHAIQEHTVEDNRIYSVAQILPINEKSAYLVIAPYTDKMVVKFIDLNGDINTPYDVIAMSHGEINLLQLQERIILDKRQFNIESIQIVIDTNLGNYINVEIS